MAHHKLLPRQYLILGLVALCAPLGDTCLSRGMTACPPSLSPIPSPSSPLSSRPGSPLGIALLIGFFASYLTALSWADLTFVLPATAFGNVIVALLSRFWLHEASRSNAGPESCSSPSASASWPRTFAHRAARIAAAEPPQLRAWTQEEQLR